MFNAKNIRSVDASEIKDNKKNPRTGRAYTADEIDKMAESELDSMNLSPLQRAMQKQNILAKIYNKHVGSFQLVGGRPTPSRSREAD